MALLLLPMLGCALLAARLGVSHWLLLLAAAVAGSGVLSLAVFWVYLVNNRLGHGFSLAVTVLSAIVLADACRHRGAGWRRLRPLLPVGALYAAASFFYTALAYLHVSFGSNTNLGPDRFNTNLPVDNVLPLLFARQLQTSVRPLPAQLLRGWQSSDRPPLQTGYYLMQQSVLHTGHFNDYELLSIMLQCLWIPGLWALLAAMGKPRRAVCLCLAAVVFNGFIFQNTIFTWPKLIAVAGVMIATAALCTRQTERLTTSRVAGALVGLSVGTAMMAHPGSAFAMIGVAGTVAVLWLVPRLRPAGWRPPAWRFLWPAGVAAGVCYEPWSLYYEKRYQPPANALTELQLANRPGPVPHKTTTQVIVGAYRHAGLHTVITNKISNFERPFIHTLDYPRWCVAVVYHMLTGNRAAAAWEAQQIVHVQFFYISTIVGVAGWGLFALYGRALWEFGSRMRARFARGGGARPQLAASAYSQDYVLLAVIGICWICWCLVLFGPGATVAHQGTYFVEPVLIALGVLGLWSLSHRLAAVVVLGSGAFTLGLYEHFTPVIKTANKTWEYNPRNPFSLGQLGIKSVPTGGVNTHPDTAGSLALLVVSVLLCVAALWWVSSDRRSPGPDELIADAAAQEQSSIRRRLERTRQLAA